MRILLAGLLLLLGAIAAPHYGWADTPTTAQSAASSAPAVGNEKLRALLENFDVSPITKAFAAECKDEGEICKTNDDCCSGLECGGGPQTTCRPQE